MYNKVTSLFAFRLSSFVFRHSKFLAINFIGKSNKSHAISVGAGTVTDLWPMETRGNAMGLVFLGQFIGPILGPVLGGAVADKWGWRSSFIVCMGYGGFLLVITFFFVTESFREIIDTGKRIPKSLSL